MTKSPLMKVLYSFVSVLIFGISPLWAQNQKADLTPAVKAAVVFELSASLIKNYIFLDTAKRMAAFIKTRLDKKAYAAVTDPMEFAQMLTDDLRSVYRDMHLAIRFNPQLEMEIKKMPAQNAGPPPEDDKRPKTENFGFNKIEILNGNVGYVRFNGFYRPTEAAKATVNSAFAFMKHVGAIVIDLRSNGGGDADMVSYICGYFFKEKTHVNDLYERRNKSLQAFWATPASDVFGPEIPVYLLVSRRTFSGAEEFSYDLQVLHRGTVVGETTGGGAHPVGPELIGNGFIANVPFARAINPITRTNWEAVGVKPDVAVNPDGALDAALLNYFDHQISTSADSDAVRSAKRSREILNARVHPVAIDTMTLKSYVGDFADRIISYEKGELFFTGREGSRTKLIALSKTTFKPENRDNVKFKLVTGPANKATALVATFDDGFVVTYKRKE